MDFQSNLTPGSQAYPVGENSWHLRIPAGPPGHYRLAQLDDYSLLQRRDFLWRPPVILKLNARASTDQQLPGTWGFGLWNDPFSLSLGFSGGARRFPVLPNAAWFFFASPPNYLSLRDDLPAWGRLAATFRSSKLPAPLLALAAPAMPLLVFRSLARGLRRLGQRFIRQDAVELEIDPSKWHVYEISWSQQQVLFRVDGDTFLGTSISPLDPLGFVVWIDNQYAAMPPDGGIRYGTLANPEAAWIEVEDIDIRGG